MSVMLLVVKRCHGKSFEPARKNFNILRHIEREKNVAIMDINVKRDGAKRF